MVARATALTLVATTLAVTGCATFEDPTLVVDLRVLAITAEPPEQVIDVDLEHPDPALILGQLRPVEIVALVADPGAARALRWSMTLCLVDDNVRCDLDRPYVELGAGLIDDPDEAAVRQTPRVLVEPGEPAVAQRMLAMVRDAVEANPVEALGGVALTVVLEVGPIDDPTAVVASKRLRISPRIPAQRTANRNPRLEYLDTATPSGTALLLARNVRCADTNDLIETVRPGTRITLFPIEPDGVRESYVVPTLDGQVAVLEETLTYQWLATRGSWSDEVTGGGRDLLGNMSLLGSDWTAPAVNQPTLVSLWMIQRDERLGSMWFETCVRVQ